MWHQTTPPHYLVTHGEPPTNVKLPCLFFTANYYLTDVDDVKHGSPPNVRGSHLLGRMPPRMWRTRPGPTASCRVSVRRAASSMFNNQVWHRGA